jgi:hypothetical protein
MKWMLLVLIFGTIPVKTGLLFDSIEDCLKAEETMRAEYAQVYNDWHAWAEAHPKDADYPDTQKVHVAARRHGDDPHLHPAQRACGFPRLTVCVSHLDNWRPFC